MRIEFEPMTKEESKASVKEMGNFVDFFETTCKSCNHIREYCKLETCKEMKKSISDN